MARSNAGPKLLTRIGQRLRPCRCTGMMSLALCLWTVPAAAEQKTISVRGSAFASAESAELLMNAAEPKMHTVAEGGESAKDIIVAACGDGQPEGTMDLLLKQLAVRNTLSQGPKFPNAPLAAGTTVEVPFCAPVFRDRRVKARDGDTLAGLVLANHPEATSFEGGAVEPHPKVLRAAIEANAGLVARECPNGILLEPTPMATPCTVHLKDGDEVVIPYSAPWVTATLSDPDLTIVEGEIVSKVTVSSAFGIPAVGGTVYSFPTAYMTANEVSSDPNLVAIWSGANSSPRDQNRDTGSIQATSPNDDVRIIRALRAHDVSSNACTIRDGDADYYSRYPIDIERVHERLERATSALAEKDKNLKTGRIAVFDTGIDRNVFNTGTIPKKFLYKNDEEVGEDDDDHNGYEDDVHGINSRDGVITELLGHGSDEKSHGTQVTTMALGGAPFMETLIALPTIPVEVAMVRVTEEITPGRPRLAADFITRALDWCTNERMDVINVSLAHDYKSASTAYRRFLTPTFGSQLLVAAAGNDAENDSTEPVHPASMGGETDPLISVGAHDQKGNPLNFSARSQKGVDIFAPGCALPVISDGPEWKYVSGTSFAAPLVSFTAALLKAMGVTHALDIKNRILVANDYDPNFNKLASSQGRLNVYKALSVFDDVIELREPKVATETMLAGKIVIENTKKLAAYCNDPDISWEIWSSPYVIRKFSIYEDDDRNFRTRYVLEHLESRRLTTKWCALKPGIIEFKPNDSEKSRVTPVHKLKDIVLRIK